MPNHITSEMTLTFNTPEGFKEFSAALKADENICQNVMPVTYLNGETITSNGTSFKVKQDAIIGLPDGGRHFIPFSDDNPLPTQSDGFWGTKWGTYDVDTAESREELVITMYFNTANSPLSDTFLLEMIEKFDIDDMSYFCYDWGMCWAESKEFQLGDISTFNIDGDDYASNKLWANSVNKFFGYQAIDANSYDDDVDDAVRNGCTTEEFIKIFGEHDGVTK